MSSLDLCCPECQGWAAEEYEPRIAELERLLAERDDELKHLHSRWDWTEYWMDNLYPSDWARCQAKYDATKVGARPVDQPKPEGGQP